MATPPKPSQDLPRAARARLGLTTDPLPEGKEVSTPELSSPIQRAKRDGDGDAEGPAEFTNEERREFEKEMKSTLGGTRPFKEKGPLPGEPTIANKLMRSDKGER